MNYALLIGNTLYDDPALKQLKAPDADLRALAEVLGDPQLGGYTILPPLLNQPFDQVQLAISELFADKRPEDLVLLYFSGHGVLDSQGRLWLAVRNTLRQRPRASGIGSPWLRDELDDCRARKQVLILDCCHSGAFGEGRKGTDAVGQPAVLPDTFAGRGRVVLTATDKTSAAWEGDKIIGGLENSLFTHYLIEGIRTGAAADEQGRVTAINLYNYVYDQVKDNQRPRLFADDQEGQIVIAHAQPPAPKIKPLSPEVLTALASPQIFVREGAVTELGRLLKGSDPGLAQAARQKLAELRDDDTQVRRVGDLAGRVLALATDHPVQEMHEFLGDVTAARLAGLQAETARQTEAERRERERQAAEKAETEREAEALARRVEAERLAAELQAQQRDELLLTLTPNVTLDLVRVPAGEFLMGSDKKQDKEAYDDEAPQHKLYLPDYLIGKTPVTVAQFAAFVKATNYKTTAETQGSGYTWTGSEWKEVKGASWKSPSGPNSNVAKKDQHPVTLISWHDALAFCQWVSQVTGRDVRLPSEAEWEKAARGGGAGGGGLWPWGNEPPDSTRCNFDMNVKDTTPVGRYSPKGDSPFGCVDMAGNVWEWTRSLWGPWNAKKNQSDLAYPYPYNAKDGRENLQADDDVARVLRGGSFYNNRQFVRCACRVGSRPSSRSVVHDGFRISVLPSS